MLKIWINLCNLTETLQGWWMHLLMWNFLCFDRLWISLFVEFPLLLWRFGFDHSGNAFVSLMMCNWVLCHFCKPQFSFFINSRTTPEVPYIVSFIVCTVIVSFILLILLMYESLIPLNDGQWRMQVLLAGMTFFELLLFSRMQIMHDTVIYLSLFVSVYSH
jgi:hypothetical protein